MSPRGFEGVRKTSANIESRRSSGGLNALWFRISDGDTAIVRFLEENDDIFWCMIHEIPQPGRQYGREVPCCNQANDGTPCPGCEADLPRKFKGYINLIWEESPVFKRDGDNRLVRDRDNQPIKIAEKSQVAVWGAGIRVFEELDELNANYRGLRSRKFKIKRKGKELNTKYTILPADIDKGGPQPFSPSEKELEAKKYDLNEFTKPLTYDAFLNEMGGGHQNNGEGSDSEGGQQRRNKDNPFMRNKA